MKYFYDKDGQIVGTADSDIVVIDGFEVIEAPESNVPHHHLYVKAGELHELNESEKLSKDTRVAELREQYEADKEKHTENLKIREEKIDELIHRFFSD